MFSNLSFITPEHKNYQLFLLTSSITIHTTYELLQKPSREDMWQAIKKPRKLFWGTSVAKYGFLNLPTPPGTKIIMGLNVFPNHRIHQGRQVCKLRFSRYVKFLTVWKYVSAVNNTIYMESNRGAGQLKQSETKWIRTQEIVLGGFGKDEPPARKKLPV